MGRASCTSASCPHTSERMKAVKKKQHDPARIISQDGKSSDSQLQEAVPRWAAELVTRMASVDKRLQHFEDQNSHKKVAIGDTKEPEQAATFRPAHRIEGSSAFVEGPASGPGRSI